jgi:hypothetical protein
MSIDGDIHAALMARVEAISGYQMVWPQKKTPEPEGEYIRVSHLPNDNREVDLSGAAMLRKGFLYLTLVSPLTQHESVTREAAGDIAAQFQRGETLSRGGLKVKITTRDVRQGRPEAERWETPIRIGYQLIA